MGQLSEWNSQVVSMFMSRGTVTLPDSVRESLVGAIREEFENFLKTCFFRTLTGLK